MNLTEKGYLISVLIVLGVTVSLVSRSRVKSKRKWRSAFSIILSDYTFDDYATISIASFVYAVLQGALLGSSLACAALILIESNWIFLVYSLSLLLFVAIVRISIEGYVAVYKTARDASLFFSLSSERLLNQPPPPQRYNAGDDNLSRSSPGFSASFGRSSHRKDLDYLVSLLERNCIDTSDLSYDLSDVNSSCATLKRRDGVIIAEVVLDPSDGSAYLLLEDGERAKLVE